MRRCLLVLLLSGSSACGLLLDLDQEETPADGGATVDAGDSRDTGLTDAARDANTSDANTGDASTGDANTGDANADDAGIPDAGTTDTGASDAGPCVPACPAGQGCSAAGACRPLCGDGVCPADEICFEGGVCGPPECEVDDECGDLDGDGCATFECEGGRCVEEPPDINTACEYCDPAAGEVYVIDEDGDGFVGCYDNDECAIEECDCDETNPLVHPDSVDFEGFDGNCDGEIENVTLFCLMDLDGDSARTVMEAEPGIACPGGGIPVSEFPSAGFLDCNDVRNTVFPGQTTFFSNPIEAGECDEGRGRCFDYNCDGRQEREFPARALCHLVRDAALCADFLGWDNIADEVPECGEAGVLRRCQWVGDECQPGAAMSAVQACR